MDTGFTRPSRRRAARPIGYPPVPASRAGSHGFDELSPATIALLRTLLAHVPETPLENERAAAEIMRLIRLDALGHPVTVPDGGG